MDMTTTNNTSFKYWIGSPNNPNMKNNSMCIIKQPIDHQSTYNHCYSEPGYYKDEKLISNSEALRRQCCKTRIN